MKFPLPPLNTLRLFEAAGRQLNFKVAAQELGLTPSAVSHGVQALEEWLGSALFHRNGRKVTLTSAGKAYLPAVTEALRLLTCASDQGADSHTASTIHISATPAFTSKILLPILHRFRNKHPHVAVTIDTAYWVVELSPDGADLAIRHGDGDWPGMSAELLLVEALVPVCSPRLLERLGKSRELASVPLIHVINDLDWQIWAEACGEAGIDLNKGLHVDTVDMATDAAVQGLGVAIARRPVIDPQLSSGDLVRFDDREVISRTSLWLVAFPGALQRPDVQAFRNWLLGELQSIRDQGELDDPVLFANRPRAEDS